MNVELIRDKDRWNQFVESHEFSHAFQLYEWGEIKRVQGWEPLRLGLVNQGGAVLGGAQILVKKLPGLPIRIAQIPFGPTLDYNDDLMVKEFFGGLHEFVKAQNCAVLLFAPYCPSSQVRNLPYANESRNGLYYRHTVLLDLAKPEDEIFQNFRATYRNEIRKAEKIGVRVEEKSSGKGMDEFYRMYVSTYRRTGRTPLSKGLFEATAKIWFPTRHARLFSAEYKHQEISSVLMLYSGKTCVYMYAASTDNPELRKIPGQKLVVWDIMKKAKDEGYHFFDLGGVNPFARKGTKGYGIYFFKTGFGGELVKLSQAMRRAIIS